MSFITILFDVHCYNFVSAKDKMAPIELFKMYAMDIP